MTAKDALIVKTIAKQKVEGLNPRLCHEFNTRQEAVEI